MITFVLELLILLLLFRRVLGYEFRREWKFIVIGIGIVLIRGIVMLLCPEAHEALYCLGILIPAAAMPFFFRGRPVILLGIGVCMIRLFCMLDAMEVDLTLTYIMGELTCLVVFLILSGILGKEKKQISLTTDKMNPIILILFILYTLIADYNPYGIGALPQSLFYIIHAENLVKNGVLAIAITVVFVLVYIMLAQRKEMKRMILLNERCISEQAEQYRLTGEEGKKWRKFRHDYNELISVLQVIAQEGDIKRLREYISTLAEIKSEHKLVYTNNLICDAILTRYAALCRAENIELKIHGTFPDQLYISDTDLCVLISNGMKNAYEAVQKCETERMIEFNIGNRGNYVDFVIANTTCEALTIEDGRPKTTKSDRRNHGLGTQNMLEAARKNGGSVTWSFNEPNLVSVEILVCCAKRNLVS